MNINKKIVFTLLLLCIVITGCSKDNEDKDESKMLLCKNNQNTVVFNFDENENVVSMYYEKIFDLNDYYTESELEELKIHKQMLPQIISEKIIDCNNTKYSCNSNYENYVITNKIYVENYEEAQLTDLDEFFGVNYDELKQDMYYKGISCEKINKDNKYVIEENVMNINIDDTIYTSIEDMNYDINKPEYYKEYTLIEFDDKKATIEFKDNGKCEINLKEFDSEYWNKSYCDNEKHKNMIKTAYLDGDCSYTVSSEYYFDIVYDGKYEHGTYCESYDDESRMQTKDVVYFPNHLIEMKFDDTYSNFTFLNGNWRKNKIDGIVQYKK